MSEMTFRKIPQSEYEEMLMKIAKNSGKHKRQYFECNYHFHKDNRDYGWTTKRIGALSKLGATDVIKWIHSTRIEQLRIDSINPTHEYYGDPIYPDYGVVGDY